MTATQPIERLTRDLRESVRLLGQEEIRYLVDLYYQLQESRITAANRERQQDQSAEPVALFGHFFDQFKTLENQARSALLDYARHQTAGEWAMEQRGIGPVLAAGLLSEIDVTRATSASHVIAFAGIAPGQKWSKGEKRPWNARLKVLCFKIGDCFMKLRNGPDGLSYYGEIYENWKKEYQRRNEVGMYEARAAQELETKKYRPSPTRTAYEHGRLPDGRIEMMARRKAVHRFLVHFWWVLYESETGKAAPRPWVEAHGGHTDIEPPPGWKVL